MLAALREGYGLALRRIFIFALAAGCAAFVFTLGMERRKLTAADGASARGEGCELEGLTGLYENEGGKESEGVRELRGC